MDTEWIHLFIKIKTFFLDQFATLLKCNEFCFHEQKEDQFEWKVMSTIDDYDYTTLVE